MIISAPPGLKNITAQWVSYSFRALVVLTEEVGTRLELL